MEANTGQSQSCISQHLMRLKAAGVVKACLLYTSLEFFSS